MPLANVTGGLSTVAPTPASGRGSVGATLRPSDSSSHHGMRSKLVQAVSRACHWALATRTRRRWLFRGGLALALLPLFLQWLIAYVLGGDARLLPPELLRSKSLLIVTAHPDDECLFFAPSILGVLDRNHDIKGSLLVLSTGMSATPPELRPANLQEITTERGNCAKKSFLGHVKPSASAQTAASP